ncbi:hypothetical protein ABTY96_42070 [Streptomyces sp. NPDC096057]|uniref:hypothetical protein n=1 Tax=Streptomyces sp. NPDC096057 TaxID=3155543 RepID=UPI003326FC8C
MCASRWTGSQGPSPRRERRGRHPRAHLYYRDGGEDHDAWSMLRAFVEVDRATMGPERLAAKLTAHERLHRHVPVIPGNRPTLQEPAVEE